MDFQISFARKNQAISTEHIHQCIASTNCPVIQLDGQEDLKVQIQNKIKWLNMQMLFDFQQLPISFLPQDHLHSVIQFSMDRRKPGKTFA